MSRGFALRFALEVAFLALLALAAGLAELDTAWIVGVMVVGWLLVVLVEWLAWRSEREPGAPVEQAESAPEVPPDDVARWDLDDIIAPMPEQDGE